MIKTDKSTFAHRTRIITKRELNRHMNQDVHITSRKKSPSPHSFPTKMGTQKIGRFPSISTVKTTSKLWRYCGMKIVLQFKRAIILNIIVAKTKKFPYATTPPLFISHNHYGNLWFVPHHSNNTLTRLILHMIAEMLNRQFKSIKIINSQVDNNPISQQFRRNKKLE